MIHLIDRTNRHLYPRALTEFHQARARCFIDERGWPLTRNAEGEFDDYDDDAAAYLIAFDDGQRLTAACRLRSTDQGGLIPDHFPHLVAPTEVPLRTPGTFECTRYFCIPELRGASGLATRSALHVAMIEHMRDVDGDRLVGFVDLPLLTHLRRFSGLRIRPIGLPAVYDGEALTVAFEIGITADDLVQTRTRLELTGRQLFVAPAWLDGEDAVHAMVAIIRSGDRTIAARGVAPGMGLREPTTARLSAGTAA